MTSPQDNGRNADVERSTNVERNTDDARRSDVDSGSKSKRDRRADAISSAATCRNFTQQSTENFARDSESQRKFPSHNRKLSLTMANWRRDRQPATGARKARDQRIENSTPVPKQEADSLRDQNSRRYKRNRRRIKRMASTKVGAQKLDFLDNQQANRKIRNTFVTARSARRQWYSRHVCPKVSSKSRIFRQSSPKFLQDKNLDNSTTNRPMEMPKVPLKPRGQRAHSDGFGLLVAQFPEKVAKRARNKVLRTSRGSKRHRAPSQNPNSNPPMRRVA